jgi:hypothetical protein
MPRVTLAWRFQTGADEGSSSRSYSAIKVCEVPWIFKKPGARYDNIFPKDKRFVGCEFVVERAEGSGDDLVLVSQVVVIGRSAEALEDLSVRAALEEAGWVVTPDPTS